MRSLSREVPWKRFRIPSWKDCIRTTGKLLRALPNFATRRVWLGKIRFGVYPAPSSSNGVFKVFAARYPIALSEDTDTCELPDIYCSALQAYAAFKACISDAANSEMQARKGDLWSLYVDGLLSIAKAYSPQKQLERLMNELAAK
jgi:hypothetical protein